MTRKDFETVEVGTQVRVNDTYYQTNMVGNTYIIEDKLPMYAIFFHDGVKQHIHPYHLTVVAYVTED